MPTIPRIVRAVPRGSITRPEPPGLPVMASIRWHDDRDQDVPAIATAWTPVAVEITWDWPHLGLRSSWIPAEDVRRTVDPTGQPAQPAPGQPRSGPNQRDRPGGSFPECAAGASACGQALAEASRAREP